MLPELGYEVRAFLQSATTGLGLVVLRVYMSQRATTGLGGSGVQGDRTAPTKPPDDFKVTDRPVGQAAMPRR